MVWSHQIPRKPSNPTKAPTDSYAPTASDGGLTRKTEDELRTLLATLHPVRRSTLCNVTSPRIITQLCKFGKMGRPSYQAVEHRQSFMAVQQELQRRGAR